jgi:ATP-dependent RNA helicase DeaD
MHKLDALTRILEVESFDAMLVFARTKQSTVDLAEKLEARGFSAAALNGDIQQSQRERTVAQLKAGQFDILVATDVAARGLDVDRISHVVNFDVPYDTESYVHRIGRTGRAGRNGEAILFIAPRERNMLRLIEKATRQPIEAMHLPTVDDVNAKRLAKFKLRITEVLAAGVSTAYRAVIEDYVQETGADVTDVAAGLASLAQGKTPLLLAKREERTEPRPANKDEPKAKDRPRASKYDPQDTYRIEIGRTHGVLPGNIVGALANEGGLDGSEINGIDIQPMYTILRLPQGMQPSVLEHLKSVKIKGRMMQIARTEAVPARRKRPNRERR